MKIKFLNKEIKFMNTTQKLSDIDEEILSYYSNTINYGMCFHCGNNRLVRLRQIIDGKVIVNMALCSECCKLDKNVLLRKGK